MYICSIVWSLLNCAYGLRLHEGGPQCEIRLRSHRVICNSTPAGLRISWVVRVSRLYSLRICNLKIRERISLALPVLNYRPVVPSSVPARSDVSCILMHATPTDVLRTLCPPAELRHRIPAYLVCVYSAAPPLQSPLRHDVRIGSERDGLSRLPIGCNHWLQSLAFIFIFIFVFWLAGWSVGSPAPLPLLAHLLFASLQLME